MISYRVFMEILHLHSHYSLSLRNPAVYNVCDPAAILSAVFYVFVFQHQVCRLDNSAFYSILLQVVFFDLLYLSKPFNFWFIDLRYKLSGTIIEIIIIMPSFKLLQLHLKNVCI